MVIFYTLKGLTHLPSLPFSELTSARSFLLPSQVMFPSLLPISGSSPVRLYLFTSVLKPALPWAERRGCMVCTSAFLTIFFVSFILLIVGVSLEAYVQPGQGFFGKVSALQPLARLPRQQQQPDPSSERDVEQRTAQCHLALLPLADDFDPGPFRILAFLHRQDEYCSLNSHGCSLQAKVKKTRVRPRCFISWPTPASWGWASPQSPWFIMPVLYLSLQLGRCYSIKIWHI